MNITRSRSWMPVATIPLDRRGRAAARLLAGITFEQLLLAGVMAMSLVFLTAVLAFGTPPSWNGQ
ncbi:MAG: hypothetical protein HZC54_13960 [Verrucomicrobia bacterium]|nr:hypothetical protein [Verrucomicrobiota bacterium]